MRLLIVHWGNFYCSSFSCDKRMTEHGYTMRSLTAHWGSFYCSPFSCDKRPSNRSGDFDGICLFLCLLVFGDQDIKVWVGLKTSLHPLPFPHHYHYESINMSSPHPTYTSCWGAWWGRRASCIDVINTTTLGRKSVARSNHRCTLPQIQCYATRLYGENCSTYQQALPVFATADTC